MNGPNNSDLQRDMGRVEGKQDAMGARLDRLEKMISEGFAEMRREIADLKQAESQRKGVLAALATIAGVIGGGVGLIIEWFVKGHGQ